MAAIGDEHIIGRETGAAGIVHAGPLNLEFGAAKRGQGGDRAEGRSCLRG